MSIREIRELRSTKLLQEQPVSQKKDKYLKNFSLTTTRINNGSQGNINTRLNKIEELLVKLTENTSESKFDGRGQSDGQARFKQLKYTYNNILGLS